MSLTNIKNSIQQNNNLEVLSKDKKEELTNIDNKEKLILAIKEWLKNDNEIKILQKEIKDRKLKNEIISKKLIETMKENEIDRFDINSGKIIYSKKNVKKPITQKLLLDLLTKYYKNDETIAQELTNYIVLNREIKITEHIIHKMGKVASPIL